MTAWTPEEVELLEDLISTCTVSRVAEKLGRTRASVASKMQRMGIGGFEKNTDLLNVYQVCLMFSVQRRTILNVWRKKGLQMQRRGRYLTIRQDRLIRFLKYNPDVWNAAKVTDDTLIRRYPWYREKKRTDTRESYFWSREDISRLHYLRHEGYSISEIARKMGCSTSSIKYKLYKKNKEENTKMEQTLDDKVREYKELLDKKEDLAKQVKENNAAKEKLEQEICQMMIDEEKPNTVVDGFSYSLSQKIMYAKKSEEKLAEIEATTGVSFFDALREQGLGDIIVEKVDPRTLQSTVANLAAEAEDNGEELPEELTEYLSIYEKLSISKRKANTKALDRARANKEEI